LLVPRKPSAPVCGEQVAAGLSGVPGHGKNCRLLIGLKVREKKFLRYCPPTAKPTSPPGSEKPDWPDSTTSATIWRVLVTELISWRKKLPMVATSLISPAPGVVDRPLVLRLPANSGLVWPVTGLT